MTDLLIPRPAGCAHIRNGALREGSTDAIRAYRHSPERVYVQIRVAPKPGGKNLRYAGITLTFEEARQLAAHLTAEAGEQP